MSGHRSGIEPVFLAASVPASPGERVLDGGTGSGAALLCLAARVPGVRGIGIERDPAQAGRATANVAANGWADTLKIQIADLLGWRADAAFDHAMANPPFYDAAGTPSPDPGRVTARQADPGLIAAWIAALARPLRHRGTLTLIVATACVPECLAAFSAAGCGSPAVVPLWPRMAVPAKLVLVRAIRGGRAPFALHPGLVLHAEGFTADAEAVLRDAAALAF